MRHQAKPQNAETFAALDLGSNSFHLIVARYQNNQLQVIDRIRAMVRLAEGLIINRRISHATSKRALAFLEQVSQRLRSLSQVRVVGTNALRKARNASGFVKRAEQVLGHKIEIISGFEEARLIYLGTAHTMQPTDDNRLIIDIGGGSTEIIIGRQFEPQLINSLEVGCVQFSEIYFNGKISAERFHEAELAAQQAIRPQQKHLQSYGWQEVIGTSGTIRAVLEVGRKLDLCQNMINTKTLTGILRHLAEVSRPKELERFGLTPERAEVFPGGLAILSALFKRLKLKEMQVSDSALREGLLWDMIGRSTDQDIRKVSIKNLANRFHADEAQAASVRDTAFGFFDAISVAWNIDDPYYRSLLGFATMVTEIGLSVSHHHHHQHGAYLFRHTDLAGFSMDQQEHIALMIYAQQHKFPVTDFKKVLKQNRAGLIKTTCLLRLALLFQRDREQRRDVPVVLSVISETGLSLKLKQSWIGRHPLSAHGLREEQAHWDKAGYRLKLPHFT